MITELIVEYIKSKNIFKYVNFIQPGYVTLMKDDRIFAIWTRVNGKIVLVTDFRGLDI